MERKMTIFEPSSFLPSNGQNVDKFNINDFEIGEKLCKLSNG